MTKVVCRYRTNLPVGVETYPRCIRANGLPKLSEKLSPLLITEHHLASGGTVELKHWFRLGIPKLVLDLLGHPGCYAFTIPYIDATPQHVGVGHRVWMR
jgi:hypothetical protein